MNESITVLEINVNEITREAKIRLSHEEYTISLKDFLTLSLAQDCVLDEITYDNLVFMDASLKCMKKAMLSLSYSPKNERTLRIKLTGAFEEEVVDHVIETLKENKLINDSELACRYAERYTEQKLWGPLRIKNELLSHGFSRTDAQNAAESFNDECYCECAVKLLKRKFGSVESANYEVRRTMKAFLMKYGYTGDLIYSIMGKYY